MKIFLLLMFISCHLFAAREDTLCKDDSYLLDCNLRPKASWSFENKLNGTPMKVILDASASKDLDGEIVRYEWNSRDGQIGEGLVLEHSFKKPGRHKITLKVTDNLGAFSLLSKYIFIENLVIGTDTNLYQDEILVLNLGDFSLNEETYDCMSSTIDNCLLKKSYSNELTMPMQGLPIGDHRLQFKIDDIELRYEFKVNAPVSNEDSIIEFQKVNNAIDEALYYLSLRGLTQDVTSLNLIRSDFENAYATLTLSEKSEVLTLLVKRLSINSGFGLKTTKQKNIPFSAEQTTLSTLESNGWALCTGFSLIAAFGSGVEAYKLHKDFLSNNKRAIALYAGITLGSVGLGIYCGKKFREDWDSIRYLEGIDELVNQSVYFKHDVRESREILGFYRNISLSSLSDLRNLPNFAQKLILALKNSSLGIFSVGGFLYKPFKFEDVMERRNRWSIDGDYIIDIVPSEGAASIKPFAISQIPSMHFSLLDTCYDIGRFTFKVVYKFEGMVREKTFHHQLYYPNWRPIISFQRDQSSTFYFYHNFLKETEPPARDYANIIYSWSAGESDEVISNDHAFTYTFPSKPYKIKLKAKRSDGIEGCRVMTFNFDV